MNMELEYHWKYYTETGVDWWADVVYDLNTDSNDFCTFMRENIALYQHTDFAQFSQVWQHLRRRDLDFGY